MVKTGPPLFRRAPSMGVLLNMLPNELSDCTSVPSRLYTVSRYEALVPVLEMFAALPAVLPDTMLLATSANAPLNRSRPPPFPVAEFLVTVLVYRASVADDPVSMPPPSLLEELYAIVVLMIVARPLMYTPPP